MKALLPLLSDPVEEVRAEAALALGRSNSEEARRALAGMFANMTGAAYEAEMKALDAYATITAKDNFPHALELQGLIPLRNYISERLGLHYDDDRLNVLHHRLSPLAAADGPSVGQALIFQPSRCSGSGRVQTPSTIRVTAISRISPSR